MSHSADSQPQHDAPWAVVLHAPEEAIWGSWIHRQVDGILVPEIMVGQPTRHGFPMPTSIGIYPDPDAPANADGYAAALAQARYLIVVCSPASADAASVEQQIRAFKRSGGEGGEERIVVLVVERELDESSNTSTGKGGDQWLPPWIRWRLNDDGSLRAREDGEPLIVDARPGRLTLDDARGELTTFLLDLNERPAPKPRSAAAAPAAVKATPAWKAPAPELPKMAPIAAAPVPAPAGTGKGNGILLAAACASLLLAGAGAWMWLAPAKPAAPERKQAASAAQSPEPRVSMRAPAEAPASTATPSTIPQLSAPEPEIAAAMPVSMNKGPSNVRLPSTIPSEPITSGITSIAPPSGEPETKADTGDTELDRWRKMRDLGDTLVERQNRDAGMIALSQATEFAETYLRKGTASTEIRLEAARMCFRLGALQRQYFSPGEASKTMEKARRILDRTKAQGDEDIERRQMLENIETFLEGMRK